MADIIIAIAIIAAVIFAVCFIVKQKKKGNPCFGCSDAGSCNHHCEKLNK